MYKIIYQDTMTCYYLDDEFNSEDDAWNYINENFFEGSKDFYDVEKIN
tara:strand:+ start:433 stop:576 length:144 start_codon:yes stop_codon:yes gene_type:complete